MFGEKELSSITINSGTAKPTPNTYSITNKLSNATNNNTAKSVTEGGSYTATITADVNYSINSISVTMGGVDITSTAVSGNTITITNATGAVIITVAAVSTLKPCTSITLDKPTLTFTNIATQTLIAAVEPSDTTDAVIWESSDATVATVNNGIVTPKSVENKTCTITAKCGTQSITCAVTVNISEYKVINTDWDFGNLSTSTGSEVPDSANPTFIRSRFIPVDKSKTYYFTNILKTISQSHSDSDEYYKAITILAYDSNKGFLKRISGTDGNYFHTCFSRTDITSKIFENTNTSYIRIRVQIGNPPMTKNGFNAVKLEEK